MNFTTTILKDRVNGRFSGTYNRDLVNEYVTMIVNYCKVKKHRKLFFDFRDVNGEVVMFERYKLAEHLASLQPDGIRIAAVVTEEQSRPAKLAEAVAVIKNVDVMISIDENEAMDWLMERNS